MKEIHFFSNFITQFRWEKVHRCIQVNDYEGLDFYHSNEKPDTEDRVLSTTQMCFLQTDWLELGYKIFVHDNTGNYEIKLGGDNERTRREIRTSHNLFKMWRNGEFEP